MEKQKHAREERFMPDFDVREKRFEQGWRVAEAEINYH